MVESSGELSGYRVRQLDDVVENGHHVPQR
jgi:hypothetical protein